MGRLGVIAYRYSTAMKDPLPFDVIALVVFLSFSIKVSFYMFLHQNDPSEVTRQFLRFKQGPTKLPVLFRFASSVLYLIIKEVLAIPKRPRYCRRCLQALSQQPWQINDQHHLRRIFIRGQNGAIDHYRKRQIRTERGGVFSASRTVYFDRPIRDGPCGTMEKIARNRETAQAAQTHFPAYYLSRGYPDYCQ